MLYQPTGPIAIQRRAMQVARPLLAGTTVLCLTGLCSAMVIQHSEDEPETAPVALTRHDDGGEVTHEEAVARAAEAHLQRKPRLQREDCSGFVEAVLAQSGVVRRGSVRQFWNRALDEGRAYRSGAPSRGHLAFFDYTYDANKNGVPDDTLTHIAVVTAVDDHGTVTMVHRPRSGIRRLRLNLRQPHRHKTGDRIINDYVRTHGYGGGQSRRLAGQLLYGFAAPPAPFPDSCVCTCENAVLSSAN